MSDMLQDDSLSYISVALGRGLLSLGLLNKVTWTRTIESFINVEVPSPACVPAPLSFVQLARSLSDSAFTLSVHIAEMYFS